MKALAFYDRIIVTDDFSELKFFCSSFSVDFLGFQVLNLSSRQ